MGAFRPIWPHGAHHKQQCARELAPAGGLLELSQHAGFGQMALVGLWRAARQVPKLHWHLVVESIQNCREPMKNRCAEAALEGKGLDGWQMQSAGRIEFGIWDIGERKPVRPAAAASGPGGA